MSRAVRVSLRLTRTRDSTLIRSCSSTRRCAAATDRPLVLYISSEEQLATWTGRHQATRPRLGGPDWTSCDCLASHRTPSGLSSHMVLHRQAACRTRHAAWPSQAESSPSAHSASSSSPMSPMQTAASSSHSARISWGPSSTVSASSWIRATTSGCRDASSPQEPARRPSTWKAGRSCRRRFVPFQRSSTV
jgi:hypothetical protein